MPTIDPMVEVSPSSGMPQAMAPWKLAGTGDGAMVHCGTGEGGSVGAPIGRDWRKMLGVAPFEIMPFTAAFSSAVLV